MGLLGISKMQNGATAYDIGAPGNANYDEAKANPWLHLPALMVLNDGTPVTTPALWEKRRGEIRALFDENIYGKYPAHIPGVTWTVTGTEQKYVSGVPALIKHVSGHVDNSAYPAVSVVIDMDVVTPSSMRGHKVPLIIGGGSIRPRPPFHLPPGQPVHRLKLPDNPPDTPVPRLVQLLAAVLMRSEDEDWVEEMLGIFEDQSRN